MHSRKQPIAARSIGRTFVQRFEVDWDDLAWSTFQNLGVTELSPGPDAVIVEIARDFLKAPRHFGVTLFANPAFLIQAPDWMLPGNFIQQARIAQNAFRYQLKAVLGRPWRAAMKTSQGIHRQLAFNGLLLVKGRHVHPHHWPDQKGGVGTRA